VGDFSGIQGVKVSSLIFKDYRVLKVWQTSFRRCSVCVKEIQILIAGDLARIFHENFSADL